jgi:hypothetical protein
MAAAMTMIPASEEAIKFVKDAMVRLGWSQSELARRAQRKAEEFGSPLRIQQQHVQNFLAGKTKKLPTWYRHVADAIREEQGGLLLLGSMTAPFRSETPIPAATPSASEIKRFLPLVLKETIGFDRGPAIDRIANGLAAILAELAKRPNLIGDKALLNIIVSDIMAKPD